MYFLSSVYPFLTLKALSASGSGVNGYTFLILSVFDNANKLPDHEEGQTMFLLVLLEIWAIKLN